MLSDLMATLKQNGALTRFGYALLLWYSLAKWLRSGYMVLSIQLAHSCALVFSDLLVHSSGLVLSRGMAALSKNGTHPCFGYALGYWCSQTVWLRSPFMKLSRSMARSG